MAISGGVLRQLSDGLAELYESASAPGGLDYAARVVSVASRLVPPDSCSYNYIGGRPCLLAWVLAHSRATGDGRARRISDFLSDRQFRSLGLYHDFYRLCGVDYQAAITVPAPGGGLIGVALNRQRHDFSAEDLELLDVMRIHVGQAAAIALLAQPGPAASPDSAANPLLTPRQARILQLVADGHADRAIARALGISIRTVQAHLQHTYRALDVTSRTEAVARLRALGATPGVSLSGRRARS